MNRNDRFIKHLRKITAQWANKMDGCVNKDQSEKGIESKICLIFFQHL